MFSGTPYTLGKQKKVAKTPLDPDLIPILSVERLLATGRQHVLFNDIGRLIDVLVPEKKDFFIIALNQTVEFAQLFPETAGSYYSHKGGLLDHLLERGYLALSRCRSYLASQESSTVSLSDEEQLWVYAIFTAALLLDVGRIPCNLIVTLYNQQGKTLGRWNPYDVHMPSLAAFYKFHFEQENWESLRIQVTPVMAVQILTKEIVDTKLAVSDGFSWIASDKRILEAWFAMMQQDYVGKTALLTIIHAIQAQTIASYFADFSKYLSMNKSPAAGAFQFPRHALDETRILAGITAADMPKNRAATAKSGETHAKIAQQDFDIANRFLTWIREHLNQGLLVASTADMATRRNADFLQKKNGQVLVSKRQIDKFFDMHLDLLARNGKQQVVIKQLIDFGLIEKKVEQGILLKSWALSLQEGQAKELALDYNVNKDKETEIASTIPIPSPSPFPSTGRR